MNFCSSNGVTDFTYDSCPVDCVTRNAPFWNAASADFAKKASGYIKIILNGTRSIGAISNTSTFFLQELPNLDSSKVKQLTVFLLHSPNQQKFETCANPKTLTILKNALAEKNINYVCEDNPDQVLFLMCFYDPFSKECQAIKYLINSSGILGGNFLFIFTGILSITFFNF
jgi:hypothetical protein